MMGQTLAIRTPEGIEFGLPLAGPVSRMLALIVDMAVVMAIAKIAEQLLAPLGFLGKDISDAVRIVAYFVISLTYMALAEWLWRGQTVGKRLLRLRVVDAGGLKLEPSQVIVRNLMRFIDALPAFYLVGGISCLASGKRQRLGDVAAGTVVIRAPKLVRPDLDQLLGGKFNSLAEIRHLAARLRQRVRPEVGAFALEALLRRDEIEPRARLKLFGDMAGYFRELVDYPLEVSEQLSDEQYVRNVAEILYRK
ncbi:MAG TPA: RDD family protein [Bryobacteraceae bacterium]|nr:RDD family protein [Bryobacteraceae bacterium]